MPSLYISFLLFKMHMLLSINIHRCGFQCLFVKFNLVFNADQKENPTAELNKDASLSYGLVFAMV